MWFAAAFLLFVGYGIAIWRRGAALNARLLGLDRKRRVLAGSLLLISSAVLLFAGLLAISAVGPKAQVTGWELPAIVLIGLGFVHLQALAALTLMSVVAVTNKPETASSTRKDR